MSKATRATRVKTSSSPRSSPVPRSPSTTRSKAGARSKHWQSSLRTQTWVTTCALLAIPPMVIAHVTGAATVNPLTAPISDYAWIPGGYLMVWFSASLLAGCGVILAHRVHRAVKLWPELRRPLRWVIGLLISFTVGLFVSGVLPTDLPEAVSPTVSSMIHRIGAGWALLALPAAGLVLAKAAAEVVPARPRGPAADRRPLAAVRRPGGPGRALHRVPDLRFRAAGFRSVRADRVRRADPAHDPARVRLR